MGIVDLKLQIPHLIHKLKAIAIGCLRPRVIFAILRVIQFRKIGFYYRSVNSFAWKAYEIRLTFSGCYLKRDMRHTVLNVFHITPMAGIG